MENKFKTKDQAEEALKCYPDEYIKGSTHFCPLINKQCDINCVCWCGPWVQSVETGGYGIPKKIDYRIIYGHCTSPMITGEITANVFQ